MSFKDELIKASEELDQAWTLVVILRNSCRDALEAFNIVAFIEYRADLLYHLENYHKLLQDIVNDKEGGNEEAPITKLRGKGITGAEMRARIRKICNGDVEDK